MKETKLDRKLNDELCSCLECGKFFYQERDLEICDNCINLSDKLWEMHDKNKLDVLDFNENKEMRERFRI